MGGLSAWDRCEATCFYPLTSCLIERDDRSWDPGEPMFKEWGIHRDEWAGFNLTLLSMSTGASCSVSSRSFVTSSPGHRVIGQEHVHQHPSHKIPVGNQKWLCDKARSVIK